MVQAPYVSRRCRVALIVLVLYILSMARAVFATQVTPADSYECLHAIDQRYNMYVADVVTTLNVKTGAVTQTSQPIITPDSLFSDDGKVAAVWQRVSENEVELLLVSIDSQQAIPIYRLSQPDGPELNVQEYQRAQSRWSPDSQQFGFIEKNNGQLRLSIVKADGQDKRSVAIETPATNVYLAGWSADGQYIAGVAELPNGSAELLVWSNDNLSLVGSGIELIPDLYQGVYPSPVAWTPQGHKLALYFIDPVTRSTMLGVWSPEQGIEATIPYNLLTQPYSAYWFSWSPDGQQFAVHDFNEMGGMYYLFGIQGNKLVYHDESNNSHFSGLMTWTADGWATYFDEIPTDNADNRVWQLSRVHAAQGKHETIETGVIEAQDSPDKQRLMYVVRQGTEETGLNFSAWLSDMDGSNKVRVWQETVTSEANITSTIHYNTWSPDSRYVHVPYMKLQKHVKEQSVIASADGSSIYTIPSMDVLWLGGDWIMYTAFAENRRSRGKEIRNLKTGVIWKNYLTAEDMEPSSAVLASVSPDGKRLVTKVVDKKVFLLSNTETLHSQEITKAELNTHYIPFNYYYLRPQTHSEWAKHIFAWSPDSSMLAYLEYQPRYSRKTDLVVIDRDGKELHRVELGNFGGPLVWTQCD